VTVQALIDNLVERGLDPAVPRLFIIDGAKALSKAIRRRGAQIAARFGAARVATSMGAGRSRQGRKADPQPRPTSRTRLVRTSGAVVVVHGQFALHGVVPLISLHPLPPGYGRSRCQSSWLDRCCSAAVCCARAHPAIADTASLGYETNGRWLGTAYLFKWDCHPFHTALKGIYITTTLVVRLCV
jgi:hypothetical protein